MSKPIVYLGGDLVQTPFIQLPSGHRTKTVTGYYIKYFEYNVNLNKSNSSKIYRSETLSSWVQSLKYIFGKHAVAFGRVCGTWPRFSGFLQICITSVFVQLLLFSVCPRSLSFAFPWKNNLCQNVRNVNVFLLN